MLPAVGVAATMVLLLAQEGGPGALLGIPLLTAAAGACIAPSGRAPHRSRLMTFIGVLVVTAVLLVVAMLVAIIVLIPPTDEFYS